MIAAILFAGWLHFHDKSVRRDATLKAYSDSLKVERQRTRMFQDSLKKVEKERDDSIAAHQQRQREHYKMSQDARLRAQSKVDRLVEEYGTHDSWMAQEIKGIEREFVQSLAHKDSVIASQDQEILLWKRKVEDRDLAISRLNADIAAATEESQRWKKKAGENDGFVQEVADVAQTALALYGVFKLVRP